MRFYNICIEGPDCSGKTTLYNSLHKSTGFKYNIQDRSYLSMKVYSKLYERDDVCAWDDLLWRDIKRNNTLYVVLMPSLETILERLNTRGDDFQDEKSIKDLYKIFQECLKEIEKIPQVLVLTSTNTDFCINQIKNIMALLNNKKGSEVVLDLLLGTEKNELIDVEVEEEIFLEDLKYSVLDNPLEKDYYDSILQKFTTDIERKLVGLTGTRQDLDSRQFVYSDDSCISLVHILFRDNKFNVFVTMRSSNVLHTLWSDYEFLKILSFRCANIFELWENKVCLKLLIRSAHKIP